MEKEYILRLNNNDNDDVKKMYYLHNVPSLRFKYQ